MIRLIASDVDGTLLPEGTSDINPEYFDVILRLKEKGACFVASSGRQYLSLERLFAPVRNEIAFISDNGAYVVCGGREVFCRSIPRDVLEDIIHYARRMEHVFILMASVDRAYTESTDPQEVERIRTGYNLDLYEVKDLLETDVPVLKVSVFCEDVDALTASGPAEAYFGDRANVLVSGEHWLDFMAPNVDKGNALAALQEQLHISAEETMAFGDNNNDLGMLGRAAESYAAAGARDEVKSRVKHGLTDTSGDAVLHVLQTLLRKKVIITVTLNPCIDRTIAMDGIRINGTNKVKRTREDISGKGINASIALQQLGAETVCAGFDYVGREAQVGKMLKKRGIASYLVPVDGPLRVNVKAFDDTTGGMTEFNEAGYPVTERDVCLLLEEMERLLDEVDPGSLLVLSGSVPGNVPPDIYKRLILLAKKRGIRTLLDASGKLLVEGAGAVPFAMKPNEDEIAMLVGREIHSLSEAAAAAGKYVERGVSYICISMGSRGAVLVCPEGTYFAPALDVPVKGIQGAGDSLVAGMCAAIMEDKDPQSILRYAVAAAGGSVSREGTQMCTREDFERLLPQVQIKTEIE